MEPRTPAAALRNIWGVGVLALVVVAGCSGTPTPTFDTPTFDTPTFETQAPSPESSGATTAQAPSAVAAPVSIVISSISAESSLIPLGVDENRQIEVPSVETPMQAGYYEYAPFPGQVGPAVILGHIDGGGQEGIFHDLAEVAVGDLVDIERNDGSTVTYRVTENERVDKDEFPTDEVYGDTSEAEIRLISCGGVFESDADRDGDGVPEGSYSDNVIVTGVLVGDS